MQDSLSPPPECELAYDIIPKFVLECSLKKDNEYLKLCSRRWDLPTGSRQGASLQSYAAGRVVGALIKYHVVLVHSACKWPIYWRHENEIRFKTLLRRCLLLHQQLIIKASPIYLNTALHVSVVSKPFLFHAMNIRLQWTLMSRVWTIFL